jgi:hypothetical protein
LKEKGFYKCCDNRQCKTLGAQLITPLNINDSYPESDVLAEHLIQNIKKEMRTYLLSGKNFNRDSNYQLSLFSDVRKTGQKSDKPVYKDAYMISRHKIFKKETAFFG